MGIQQTCHYNEDGSNDLGTLTTLAGLHKQAKGQYQAIALTGLSHTKRLEFNFLECLLAMETGSASFCKRQALMSPQSKANAFAVSTSCSLGVSRILTTSGRTISLSLRCPSSFCAYKIQAYSISIRISKELGC